MNVGRNGEMNEFESVHSSIMRVPSCHPDRKHLCKGLCKNCYYKQKRLDNLDRWAGYSLKHRHGLTWDQYTKMLHDQDGKCAICRKVYTRRRICVDHNHSTGKTRGLLCDSCNKNVGVYETQHEQIEEYLRRYE